MPTYLINPIDGSRWAMVPESATEEMQDAGWEARQHLTMTRPEANVIVGEIVSYRAMLQAAPEFPVEAMAVNIADIICDTLFSESDVKP
ncbi:MAG TPA: hypothetical protein VM639_24565 [Dongiaceae bacterium]|nr:hypothetical protein [Dongiaceae bacterium]